MVPVKVVKRNCGRLGYYARECPDETGIKAVEVENAQDEQMVALTLNSLQVEENAGRAGEQVLQMFKLQVEPSGADRAQGSGKSAESDGLNGGMIPGNSRSYGHGSNGGTHRSFSGTNGGNSHKRSGRGGRCWKCGKFGYHHAECWTR